ncbi:MAG: lactonase family protein [Sphingobacteriales bacterium]
MKKIKTVLAATSVLLLTACQKQSGLTDTTNNSLLSESPKRNTSLTTISGSPAGYVYTLSNEVSGNKVLVYSRSVDGTLSFAGDFATGGNGAGDPLLNQGGINLGADNILLAVNAGSNSISSLLVNGGDLDWKSTISSGGTRPLSITRYGNYVFVLNGGTNSNISGFILNTDGTLTAIPNSTRPLSTPDAQPSQIEFVNNGTVLVVTERATDKIITYTVDGSGIPQLMHSITAANPTPFGFAQGANGNIFVSEAAGGLPGVSSLSSYHINADGSIALIKGPVFTNHTSACWVVLTNSGKYAYTINSDDGTISTFDVNTSTGNIKLNTATSASAQPGLIDAALTNNSKFEYVLNIGDHSISAFAVAGDGSLSNIQTVTGLPLVANGLIAR